MKQLSDYLEKAQNLHYKKIDLSLARIQKVYKNIFPRGLNCTIISIAGTNGKGSTGAFLANILNNAKISYGWFSSPHINNYNERFMINNNYADDAEIIDAFEIIEQHRKDITLSYFEFSTLIAIILFNNHNVAIAIIEVGLGGRLDSTNILDIDIAIITSIGFDHEHLLGNTLKNIAHEKLGIARANKPVVLPKNIDKNAILFAKQHNAIIYLEDKLNLTLSMLGGWQKYNAALAKRVALLINKNLDHNLINHALITTKINARAQTIYYKNKRFLLDVAHNPQAVDNLSSIITKDFVAIFAVMSDKNYQKMIASIRHKIKFWYLIPLDDSRALNNYNINKYVQNSKICLSAKSAVTDVINSEYNNIVVFGSFLTISAITKFIV